MEGRHARRVRVRRRLGSDLGHVHRRCNDVSHDDGSYITRLDAERTGGLVEPGVRRLLEDEAQGPDRRARIARNDRRLNVAGWVTLGRIQTSRQVAPQLLVAERVDELRPGRARVLGVGEQREADLLARIRVDRALQVLHPDQSRCVREERRKEQVRRIDEVRSSESAVIRQTDVERQNRGGEILTRIQRHVHVRPERGEHLVDRVAADRESVVAPEERGLVQALEPGIVRDVREIVDEVQHRLVARREVPGQAALSDRDSHRVLPVRDPDRVAFPVLDPRVLLRREPVVISLDQRYVEQVRIGDLRLLLPGRRVVAAQDRLGEFQVPIAEAAPGEVVEHIGRVVEAVGG